MRAVPTDEEIDRIVLNSPKVKSPGEDVVTYDCLQCCWEFVGDGCKAMVRAFWVDAKLLENTVNGIMKLIPKRSDLLEFLDNWRNLTMLTTYKVISKILIECLKPMVPNMVDQQQTGFVMGHCITDNILALKLG